MLSSLFLSLLPTILCVYFMTYTSPGQSRALKSPHSGLVWLCPLGCGAVTYLRQEYCTLCKWCCVTSRGITQMLKCPFVPLPVTLSLITWLRLHLLCIFSSLNWQVICGWHCTVWMSVASSFLLLSSLDTPPFVYYHCGFWGFVLYWLYDNPLSLYSIWWWHCLTFGPTVPWALCHFWPKIL